MRNQLMGLLRALSRKFGFWRLELMRSVGRPATAMNVHMAFSKDSALAAR